MSYVLPSFGESNSCALYSFDVSRFGKDRGEDKLNTGWCWIPYGTGSKTKGHRCASEKLQESVIKMFGVRCSSCIGICSVVCAGDGL